jgi:hypothetical protein
MPMRGTTPSWKMPGQGWMIGYGDCYGTRPCFTKPLAIASRAEAAAMVVRTYGLPALGSGTRLRRCAVVRVVRERRSDCSGSLPPAGG